MVQGPFHPRLVLATDLDDTLVGEPEGLTELWRELAKLKPYRLVYLTGRSLEQVRLLMDEAGLPVPDVLATDAGTQIWRPSSQGGFVEDSGWARRMEPGWDGPAVKRAAARVAGLEPQPVKARWRASYWLTEDEAAVLPRLRQALEEAGLQVELVVSAGLYLDLVPAHAGKGAALRYLLEEEGWPREAVLVCGDSGNDRSMLEAGFRAVVVANHRPELAPLRGRPWVYFAKSPAAWGILEGLRHHGWPVNGQLPPAAAR